MASAGPPPGHGHMVPQQHSQAGHPQQQQQIQRPVQSVSPNSAAAEERLVVATTEGIENLQRLRRNVQRIFDHLATGVTERGDTSQSDEKIYSKELKELLSEVLDVYERIEKTCGDLSSRHYPILLSQRGFYLANQNLLESRDVYQQLMVETDWIRKGLGRQHMFDQALNFVRTSLRSNPSSQNVEFVPLQSNGTANIVLLIVKPVMQVAMVMRGYMIEWISIKGLDEAFLTDDDRDVDLSAESAYPLFREFSAYIKASFLNHQAHLLSSSQQPLSNPTIVQHQLFNNFRQQISQLLQYKTLFQVPCAVCRKILRDRMPPYCREIRDRIPPHAQRPGVVGYPAYQAVHRACRT